MIKLQPNQFSADLIPLNNPRQKDIDEKTAWVNKVDETLKGRKKPLNSPNIVSVSDQAYKEFAVEYAFTGASRGEYSGIWPEYTFLPNPVSTYKLGNINSLRMSVAWTIDIPGIGSFPGFPTPDSSWSVDFYLFFVLRPAGEGNATLVPTLDSQAVWQYKFTATYDIADPDIFNIKIPQGYQEYDLLDITEDRPVNSAEQPIFDGVNDSKLTRQALSLLLTGPCSLGHTFGLDKAQYDSLSAANKDHVLNLFGNRFEYVGPPATIPATTGALRSGVHLVLSYGGTFANY